MVRNDTLIQTWPVNETSKLMPLNNIEKYVRMKAGEKLASR